VNGVKPILAIPSPAVYMGIGETGNSLDTFPSDEFGFENEGVRFGDTPPTPPISGNALIIE